LEKFAIMLREVLRDLLHFLIALDWACALIIWAMGIRTAFLRANEYWEHGFFTLGLPPPPREVSKRYYVYYRQSIWLGAAFLGTLAVGALLIWLDRLFFAD